MSRNYAIEFIRRVRGELPWEVGITDPVGGIIKYKTIGGSSDEVEKKAERVLEGFDVWERGRRFTY